jgi:glyoxylase-like metal-dependent hydrolase (beta-lactamase superfamily II)
MDWRPLKVAHLVADGETLDLGGRTVEIFNLPGHTTESVVLLDRKRNQVFTGDFVYRHLGGIIAFASGSDLTAYKESSTQLLQFTNAETLFFGAHGIPQFDRDWLVLLDRELDRIIKGTATYRYAAHYLAPGLPWRVYQTSDLYIYTTPLVDPPIFWSKWMGLLVVTMSFLSLYLLYRMARPRSYRKPSFRWEHSMTDFNGHAIGSGCSIRSFSR